MSEISHQSKLVEPKRHYTTRKTLGLYWSVARRYRRWLVLHLSAASTAVLLQNVLVPWLLSQGVRTLPAYLRHPHHNFWASFGSIITLYIAAQIAQWIIWRLSGLAIVMLQSRLNRDLEQRVFAHLTTLSYRFFADNFGGALVTQANRFVSASERLYDTVAFELMPLLLKLVASFAIICLFAPFIAIGLLVFTTIYIASIIFLFRRKMPLTLRAIAAQTRVTARLADNITNMPAIKYFAHEASEIEHFNRLSRERMDLHVRDWGLQEIIFAWQGLLITAFETIVFVSSINLVASGKIDLGQFVLIQAFIWNIFGSLWSVGRIVRNVERAFGDAAEMTQILTTPAEIQDRPGAKPATITKGEVAFRNVDFAYQEERKHQTVFTNLDLTIRPGEKVGLVGPSGGGKTTITKLLLRLMDTTGGQILLDGHDISQLRQTDVRRAISYVPQEPLLFHRSLEENILYGRPDATQAEVYEAARKAHAHEFIEQLSGGYGTMVGERGVKLSGGQRQRVAIARAMLKNAPVLVLDEATSALDSESEKLIQSALWDLMEGRTAIVIAHRLSTIQRMDRIIVLEDGAIAEQGTHAELLARGGVYARLWTHQSGGFIEED